MLRAKGELEVVKQALREYNPYQGLKGIYTLETKAIHNPTFSQNGQFLATSITQYGEDTHPYEIPHCWGVIGLWDVCTRKNIARWRDAAVDALAFSSGNQYLFIGTRKGVTVLDTSEGRKCCSFGSDYWITSVAVSPDGYTLASGYIERYGCGIALWNLSDVFQAKRRPVSSKCILKEHSKSVQFLAFSPDGQTLISREQDNTCGAKSEFQLWSVSTGKLLSSFEQNVIEPDRLTRRNEVVTFSPDNRVLVAGYDVKTHAIKVWNLFTGKILQNLSVASCGKIAFSPDCRTLATTSDEMQVLLWDLETGKLICILSHLSPPRHIVFSPDGKTLATTSSSDQVHLWRIQGID
jgi:WD40 repeat protein